MHTYPKCHSVCVHTACTCIFEIPCGVQSVYFIPVAIKHVHHCMFIYTRLHCFYVRKHMYCDCNHYIIMNILACVAIQCNMHANVHVQQPGNQLYRFCYSITETACCFETFSLQHASLCTMMITFWGQSCIHVLQTYMYIWYMRVCSLITQCTIYSIRNPQLKDEKSQHSWFYTSLCIYVHLES